MNDSTLRAKWLSDQNLRGDDGVRLNCTPVYAWHDLCISALRRLPHKWSSGGSVHVQCMYTKIIRTCCRARVRARG